MNAHDLQNAVRIIEGTARSMGIQVVVETKQRMGEMGKKGKKYRESMQKVDRSKRYDFREAVQLALECAHVKFDETVDIAVRLGVDPRHADQMVRGTVVLPHGVGKETRVLVFAKGEKEREALEAGADYAGSDDYVDQDPAGLAGIR